MLRKSVFTGLRFGEVFASLIRRSWSINRRLCNLSIAVEQEPNDQTANKTKGSKRDNNVAVDLTVDQSQKILDEFNSRTLEQLTSTKHIGKNKAEALVNYRQDNGPLKSLSELNSIKGYGKAFFSWLEGIGELPQPTKKFSRQHEILSTLVPDNQKQKISNIVSIDIGLQNAAWVHMDRDCKVLAWQQAHISRPKPYNPAVLKPQVQSFVDTLPTTDAYVVEMQSHRVGKHAVALLPFVIHLRIMEAMLHCLLSPPVVPLDPHYTSRLFGLPTGHAQKKKAAVTLVQSLFLERKDVVLEDECEKFLKEKSGLEGSEILVNSLVKVPTSHNDNETQATAVSQLITPSSSHPELQLQISGELIEYFQSCKKKDDLSDSLLQALAFYNLLEESLK